MTLLTISLGVILGIVCAELAFILIIRVLGWLVKIFGKKKK